MRLIGLVILTFLVSSVVLAKPDRLVYPNSNSYRDPAIANDAAQGYVKVIREYCPGGGRGLIHFLNVDGKLIRIRGTWPTYLELAPGEHRLGMEFMGTATDIWSTWQGVAEVPFKFESGHAYVIRYHRTATDAFRVWVEEIEGFEVVNMATVLCEQAEFPDKGLHQ